MTNLYLGAMVSRGKTAESTGLNLVNEIVIWMEEFMQRARYRRQN